MQKHLFSFGHGYTAQALSRVLPKADWAITGTTRKPEKQEQMRQDNVTPLLWDSPDIDAALARADAVLISAGPDAQGDPVLRRFSSFFKKEEPKLDWLGYLSTTGVYGDHAGNWVDETTPLTPSTRRGKLRLNAEQAWRAIPDLPLHIFRLAGIYGPGRGPFSKVRQGTAQRIIKPNQIFSRIHVADIAQVLKASLHSPNPGAIYNVCDDDPAPPQDVIGHAAALLNTPFPPEIAFEKADLSPMARSFYAESKKVRNQRIKTELGVNLLYPSYRDGLPALLEEETKNQS